MLSVHHLENSRSQRILWLLEELGLEYDIKRYQRDPETELAPPELLAVHSLGKAPVITDDGVTVAESGAIVEYIMDKYGQERLIPPRDTPERLSYTYWLHYAEGTLMPLMLMSLVIHRIETAPVPFFLRPLTRAIGSKVREAYLDANIERNLAFIETALATHSWFAGANMTAADIQMSFPLEAAAARTDLEESHPHLKAFLDRIHARPAYRRALEKGGPYQLLA